jgi:hypothetical protein
MINSRADKHATTSYALDWKNLSFSPRSAITPICDLKSQPSRIGTHGFCPGLSDAVQFFRAFFLDELDSIIDSWIELFCTFVITDHLWASRSVNNTIFVFMPL